MNTQDHDLTLRDALRASHAGDPTAPPLDALLTRASSAPPEGHATRWRPALLALAAAALVSLGLVASLASIAPTRERDVEPRVEGPLAQTTNTPTLAPTRAPLALDSLDDDGNPWGFDSPTDFLLDDALDTSTN